jgi:hypothetical protein
MRGMPTSRYYRALRRIAPTGIGKSRVPPAAFAIGNAVAAASARHAAAGFSTLFS